MNNIFSIIIPEIITQIQAMISEWAFNIILYLFFILLIYKILYILTKGQKIENAIKNLKLRENKIRKSISYDKNKLSEIPYNLQKIAFAKINNEIDKKVKDKTSSERFIVEKYEHYKPYSQIITILISYFFIIKFISPLVFQKPFPLSLLWNSISTILLIITILLLLNKKQIFKLFFLATTSFAIFFVINQVQFFDFLQNRLDNQFFLTLIMCISVIYTILLFIFLLKNYRGIAIGAIIFKQCALLIEEVKEPILPRYHTQKYQCGRCGHSFFEKVSSCPNCGAKFTGINNYYDKTPPKSICVREIYWYKNDSYKLFFYSCLLPLCFANLLSVLLNLSITHTIYYGIVNLLLFTAIVILCNSLWNKFYSRYSSNIAKVSIGNYYPEEE